MVGGGGGVGVELGVVVGVAFGVLVGVGAEPGGGGGMVRAGRAGRGGFWLSSELRRVSSGELGFSEASSANAGATASPDCAALSAAAAAAAAAAAGEAELCGDSGGESCGAGTLVKVRGEFLRGEASKLLLRGDESRPPLRGDESRLPLRGRSAAAAAAAATAEVESRRWPLVPGRRGDTSLVGGEMRKADAVAKALQV